MSLTQTNVAVDTVWVIAAAVLVMFMQAGFAFLEMGFSRMKNAGAVVAKVLTNFSICAVVFWAVGFAIGFGKGNLIFGHTGFALNSGDVLKDFPGLSASDVGLSAKWWFEFVFCAVSLAVVWGTTLERLKFGVYLIYAIDTRTGRLIRRIRVGRGPHGLCVYPQPGRYSLGHTGVFR